MRAPKRPGSTGFTLIELLVVIAIICIMAAILFPAYFQAKEAGRRTRCAVQLKQINTAMLMYVDDWGGRFPVTSWHCRIIDMLLFHRSGGPYIQDCLYKYIKNDRIWLCPSFTRNDRVPAYMPGEDYSIYTWADNCGATVGKNAASNYMWNHARSWGLTLISGTTTSLIVRPTKAVMFFELPYWASPPHLASGTNRYRGNLMGLNIAYFDGHVKFVVHNYENVWSEMSNDGWHY